MLKVKYERMYIGNVCDADYGRWIIDTATVEKLSDLENPDYHIEILEVEDLEDDFDI